MLTTIQIRKKALKRLLKFKAAPKETYEQVIGRLMDQAERERAKEEGLLREGYLEMAQDAKRIHKEWGAADAGWD